MGTFRIRLVLTSTLVVAIAAVIAFTNADTVPSCSITFDTNPIDSGKSTTIRWSSTNASLFYIQNVGYVGASGSAQVSPGATTDYSGYVSDSTNGSDDPKTYVVDIFEKHGGYSQGQCFNDSFSHTINSSARYVILDGTTSGPGGPSWGRRNCMISNQSGSLSKAKIKIINAAGEIVYQSPSEVDCGDYYNSEYDIFGNSLRLYQWNSSRRVDLDPAGAPYKITTEGSGCNGTSYNYLITWAGVQVTEGRSTTATCPAQLTVSGSGQCTPGSTSSSLGEMKSVYLTTGSSWTVPSDWNSSSNSIEVIGGGGGGASSGGGGGGGGAYSKVSNLSLEAGNAVSYSIGSGGSVGGNGGDSYFNGPSCSSASVCARGGSKAITSGGDGGSSSKGIGSTMYSGGDGGNQGSCSVGGGGGGAAGRVGNGMSGGTAQSGCGGSAGGAGDAGSGGAGGSCGSPNQGGDPGDPGSEWGSYGSGGGGCGGSSTGDGGAGGSYGAGGGGGGPSNSGASGSSGLIVISYRPMTTASTPGGGSSALVCGADGNLRDSCGNVQTCQYGCSTETNQCKTTCNNVFVCNAAGTSIVNACDGSVVENCQSRGAGWRCASGACVLQGVGFRLFDAIRGNNVAFTASGHLQAIPSLVREGDPSRLYWNVTNAASCTVRGSNGDGVSGGGAWNADFSGANGVETSPIMERTTYTLRCTSFPGATPASVEESATIDVTPTFQET